MTHQAARGKRSFATRVPGVRGLAGVFGRLAAWRVGRVPVGLLALLPVALFIDLFDAADELALGPIGMAVSFVVEAAFLLALTGRTSYAVGFAGIDLIPGVDLIPFATLTLLSRVLRAWREGPDEGKMHPEGVVIDV